MPRAKWRIAAGNGNSDAGAGSARMSFQSPKRTWVSSGVTTNICMNSSGGAPMVVAGEAITQTEIDPGFADGTAMGKRYGGDDLPVELLCTKPGPGTLSIGTEPLPLKEAKALPASD